MPELSFIFTAIGWLLAPVCSALVVAVIERGKTIKRERAEKARILDEHQIIQDKALKVLMRSQLVDAYGMYVSDGNPLTVERKHELTELFQVYTALGGNGTGKAMYEALSEVPITIVGSSNREGVSHGV